MGDYYRGSSYRGGWRGGGGGRNSGRYNDQPYQGGGRGYYDDGYQGGGRGPPPPRGGYQGGPPPPRGARSFAARLWRCCVSSRDNLAMLHASHITHPSWQPTESIPEQADAVLKRSIPPAADSWGMPLFQSSPAACTWELCGTHNTADVWSTRLPHLQAAAHSTRPCAGTRFAPHASSCTGGGNYYDDGRYSGGRGGGGPPPPDNYYQGPRDGGSGRRGRGRYNWGSK